MTRNYSAPSRGCYGLIKLEVDAGTEPVPGQLDQESDLGLGFGLGV